MIRHMTVKDVQGLDPNKVWVINAPTIEAADHVAQTLEAWQKQHPDLKVHGIIMSDSMDLEFKEVSDEWLEAYIRSMQDILQERKNKHETTNTDAP